MVTIFRVLLSAAVSVDSYSYSQPEDTKLTAMEVDVEELWTKTVTRIPTTMPATGLDRIAFFWKISPAALPVSRR